jgi:hypothetical protein
VIFYFNSGLNIQVAHFLGVRLDELAAGIHRVTHQRVETAVGFCGIVDVDHQQGSVGGIHRGLLQLRWVHLAQALIALHHGCFHDFS